jgi:hypothetical protein
MSYEDFKATKLDKIRNRVVKLTRQEIELIASSITTRLTEEIETEGSDEHTVLVSLLRKFERLEKDRA